MVLGGTPHSSFDKLRMNGGEVGIGGWGGVGFLGGLTPTLTLPLGGGDFWFLEGGEFVGVPLMFAGFGRFLTPG